MKNYTRLTREERWHIAVHHGNGKSIGWISRTLNRHHATISRELRRNRTVQGYKAEQAHTIATNRHCYRNQQRSKIKGNIFSLIVERIQQYWSPRQTSGWLRKTQGLYISHETIYQRIWRDKHKGGTLYRYLRHGGRKYQKRGQQKYAGRGYIPGRIDIEHRPEIVAKKSRIGDWELDTIVGANHQGYLVSMVERFSKYTKLVLIPDCKADTVKTALLTALSCFKNKVLTLTADNGKEFSLHQEVATALEASFFFAKPYHSWERGLNEHTNGLVRQFLPKGTNFLTISHEKVQWIENLLNNRPREILNFKTPQQVFMP